VALSTDQIKALTMAQVDALYATTTLKAAITADQQAAMPLSSPIVLDLNGNGINTLNLSAGVQFDLLATGNKSNVGWVGGGDGLLVLDRNGDGVINNGSALFGEGTTLANGQKAANGYQALAELDANGDGVIDAKDTQFNNLRVWVDGNADGVSQADELKSLADLNIAKLNLDVQKTSIVDNGNLIGMVSTFETTDGAVHQAADVWFQDSSKTAGSLTSSVSSLSNALSSFDAAATSTANTAKLELPSSVNSQVAAMASAIGNFEHKLTASTHQAATEDSLRLKALQGGHGQGILAAK